MFNTIEIDRSNLTIMGVKFSDLKTLESTANALGVICLKDLNRHQKVLKL
jgi:hypothetical protein